MHLDDLIRGNDTVQRHLAQEREKAALLVVSPYARETVEREILPQIEENVSDPSMVDDLRDSTKASIEQAFRAKNQVYTRLVSYKSIDQGDQQYLHDLLAVLDEWARKTRGTLESGDGDESEPVKLKIEVESEVDVKVENDDGVSVEVSSPETAPAEGPRSLGAPAGDEEIPVADDFDFSLGDVRL